MQKPTEDYKLRLQKLFAGITSQGRLRDLRDLLQRACRAYGAQDCVVEKTRDGIVSHTYQAF